MSTARSRTPSDPGAVRSRSARSWAATTAAGSGGTRRDGQSWGWQRSPVAGRPAVAEHQVIEGQADRPAPALESGGRRTLVGPADAQPAEGGDPGRGADQPGQLSGVEQRDPAEAQALRPGRQPQVLDGAGARPQVGVDEGRPAEHTGGRHPPIAAHDQPDRRFPDPLEIEVEQLTAGVRRHGCGLVDAGPVGEQCGSGP